MSKCRVPDIDIDKKRKKVWLALLFVSISSAKQNGSIALIEQLNEQKIHV
jgi:hypothetical protein